MQTIVTAAVDQPWKDTTDSSSQGSMWILPLVIVGMLIAAMLIQRRPWILLALGLSLAVVIPLGSCMFK